MKWMDRYLTVICVLGLLAITCLVVTGGYYWGEKAGYRSGWDSACATFGPRDNPNLCSVSLHDAERFRK